MPYQKPLPKPLYEPTDQGSLRAFTHYKEMLERKYKPVNHLVDAINISRQLFNTDKEITK